MFSIVVMAALVTAPEPVAFKGHWAMQDENIRISLRLLWDLYPLRGLLWSIWYIRIFDTLGSWNIRDIG